MSDNAGRARKKWQTRWPKSRSHASQAAAYRWVAHIAWDRRNGTSALIPREVNVYVDERDGRGWQLYERIDLDALPS